MGKLEDARAYAISNNDQGKAKLVESLRGLMATPEGTNMLCSMNVFLQMNNEEAAIKLAKMPSSELVPIYQWIHVLARHGLQSVLIDMGEREGVDDAE